VVVVVEVLLVSAVTVVSRAVKSSTEISHGVLQSLGLKLVIILTRLKDPIKDVLLDEVAKDFTISSILCVEGVVFLHTSREVGEQNGVIDLLEVFTQTGQVVLSSAVVFLLLIDSLSEELNNLVNTSFEPVQLSIHTGK